MALIQLCRANVRAAFVAMGYDSGLFVERRELGERFQILLLLLKRAGEKIHVGGMLHSRGKYFP